MAPWLLAFSLSLCVAELKADCARLIDLPQSYWNGSRVVSLPPLEAVDTAQCEPWAITACMAREAEVCRWGDTRHPDRCRQPASLP